MAVYLHATLEVRPGQFTRFCETMDGIASIVEAVGWKLDRALVQRTGRLNTVIDLWQLEDFNHFDRGIQAIAAHERAEELQAGLAETVQAEALVFATQAPYSRS
jgi:hypothetical protein